MSNETEPGRSEDLLAYGRRVLSQQPFSVLLGTELEQLEPGRVVQLIRDGEVGLALFDRQAGRGQAHLDFPVPHGGSRGGLGQADLFGPGQHQQPLHPVQCLLQLDQTVFTSHDHRPRRSNPRC